MTQDHSATAQSRQEALEEIAAQVRRCQLCPLYKGDERAPR